MTRCPFLELRLSCTHARAGPRGDESEEKRETSDLQVTWVKVGAGGGRQTQGMEKRGRKQECDGTGKPHAETRRSLGKKRTYSADRTTEAERRREMEAAGRR